MSALIDLFAFGLMFATAAGGLYAAFVRRG